MYQDGKDVEKCRYVGTGGTLHNIPIRDALGVLNQDSQEVMATEPDSHAGQMLSTGAAYAVMETLVQSGETSIPIDIGGLSSSPIMRVAELLKGASQRLADLGKEDEAADRFEVMNHAEAPSVTLEEDYTVGID